MTRRAAFAMLAAVLGLGAGLATLDRIAPGHRATTSEVTTVDEARASVPRAPQFPERGIVPAAFCAGLLLAAGFAVGCILGGAGHPARIRAGRGPAPRAPTRPR